VDLLLVEEDAAALAVAAAAVADADPQEVAVVSVVAVAEEAVEVAMEVADAEVVAVAVMEVEDGEVAAVATEVADVEACRVAPRWPLSLIGTLVSLSRAGRKMPSSRSTRLRATLSTVKSALLWKFLPWLVKLLRKRWNTVCGIPFDPSVRIITSSISLFARHVSFLSLSHTHTKLNSFCHFYSRCCYSGWYR
jgi:hypothetical protein